MEKELTLFGSFGFGNSGDEAVPLAIQDICEQKGIALNLNVVSRYDNPKLDEVIGLDEKYLQKLEVLAGKDMVLCGGGIIEPRKNCCLAKLEKFREIVMPGKVSIIAGSFEYGVDYGWRFKRKLANILSSLDKVYTRDYISEIFFHECFPNIPVSTIGDVVLGMKADQCAMNSCDFPDRNEYIAVSLCASWSDDPQWYQWITSELSALSDYFDKPVVFVSMSQFFDQDIKEHKLIADRMVAEKTAHHPYVIEDILSPRQVAGIFRDAQLVVSMRLHGCVMAFAQETPFVGLTYHPKLQGFAQTVGWKHFLLPKRYNLRQNAKRYGNTFSSIDFSENDLLDVCKEALEYGSFKLLPMFVSKLGELFENEILGYQKSSGT